VRSARSGLREEERPAEVNAAIIDFIRHPP
jgi:hypothetical protein